MRECELRTGIQGMYCAECADVISSALLYTKGILRADCSYWKNSLDAVYDPDLISEEEIREKLKKIGYPAGEAGGSSVRTELLTAALVIILTIFLQNIRLPAVPHADDNSSSVWLFSLGLVTGFHCIAMCGGWMLSGISSAAVPGERAEKKKNSTRAVLLPALSYNLARILMGTVLGAAFGAVGKIFSYTDDLRRLLFLFCGTVIVWTGLDMWGIFPVTGKVRAAFPRMGKWSAAAGGRLSGKPFLMGAFNAFLPCSSSQMIWLAAAASGNAGTGALCMLFSGLGTVPAMLAFGIFGGSAGRNVRNGIRRVTVIMIMAMGLRMFLRAL